VKKTEPEAVLAWLAQEGYPLEVSVGKICRAKGWLTFQSFSYTDPNESKLRACDVYASRFVHAGGITLNIDLAIECKRSPDKPWVVFGEPVGRFDWLIPSMLAPGFVAESILMLLPNEPTDLLAHLRPEKWVGYSLVKAHSSGKPGDPSNAYSALRATMTAAEAFALRSEQELREDYEWPPSLSVVLPVLVVGAPFYLYTSDENNEEHLEPVEFMKVTAPQRRFEDRCLVTVVSENAFPSWLAQMSDWADKVLAELTPKAAGIPRHIADMRRARDLVG
jgi:hypothetical protein